MIDVRIASFLFLFAMWIFFRIGDGCGDPYAAR